MTNEAKQVSNRMGKILLELAQHNRATTKFWEGYHNCLFCKRYAKHDQFGCDCTNCFVFRNLGNKNCRQVFKGLYNRVVKPTPTTIHRIMAIIIWMEDM